MKKLLIIIVLIILISNQFSCTKEPHYVQNEKSMNIDSLYQKYKSMINAGKESEACVDCAAMALAISYGIDDEIIKNTKKLKVYYKKHGSVPCPELLCKHIKQ